MCIVISAKTCILFTAILKLHYGTLACLSPSVVKTWDCKLLTSIFSELRHTQPSLFLKKLQVCNVFTIRQCKIMSSTFLDHYNQGSGKYTLTIYNILFLTYLIRGLNTLVIISSKDAFTPCRNYCNYKILSCKKCSCPRRTRNYL